MSEPPGAGGGTGGGSRRGSGAGRGLESGDGDRVLLTEATAQFRWDWRIPKSGTRRTRPPTVDDLERLSVRISKPGPNEWKFLSEKQGELRIARRLRKLGIDVASIEEVRLKGFDGQKSPDALVVGTDKTVEFKTITSADRIEERMKEAAKQSRRVVLLLDPRKVKRDRTQVANAVARVLRERGGHYDEVLVLGKDFGLLWPWP